MGGRLIRFGRIVINGAAGRNWDARVQFPLSRHLDSGTPPFWPTSLADDPLYDPPAGVSLSESPAYASAYLCFGPMYPRMYCIYSRCTRDNGVREVATEWGWRASRKPWFSLFNLPRASVCTPARNVRPCFPTQHCLLCECTGRVKWLMRFAFAVSDAAGDWTVENIQPGDS